MATRAGTLNNKGGTARPNGRDGQATRCSDIVALLASVGIACVGSLGNLSDRRLLLLPQKKAGPKPRPNN
ncbi:hypothetical protein [Nostoc sp. UIC 10630]|uniref:hypothetical protein n=1 Tax=Nostoc sp. UIC 10630 TaxID=2100146 RepID=UPI0013D0E91F|nr:hypothetical protein [Nostoc sp. UIC 10630]NEU77651.1 hypothetical protein [Nostoc sp. UIC 10630]